MVTNTQSMETGWHRGTDVVPVVGRRASLRNEHPVGQKDIKASRIVN
jgi:hypothetical protein